MRKYLLAVVFALVVSVFGANVMALENDYKNNLLKIDITKVDKENYEVDLYTQKPYNEPIKVIKKSDTSYYILLPETSHSVTSAAAGGDVKNIDVKLCPYSGEDVNNGYTKINITTNKPINFSTDVKTASSAPQPKIDSKKLAELDSVFGNSKTTTSSIPVAPKQSVSIKSVEIKRENAKEIAKYVQADSIAVEAVPPTRAERKKSSVIPMIQPSATAEQAPRPREAAKRDNFLATTKTPAESTQEAPRKVAGLEEVTDESLNSEDATLDQAAVEQGLTEEATEPEIVYVSKVDRIKYAIKNFISMAKDNALVLFAPLLLFVLILLFLAQRRKRKAAKQVVTPEPTSSDEILVYPQPEETFKDTVQEYEEYKYEPTYVAAPQEEPSQDELYESNVEPFMFEEEGVSVLSTAKIADHKGLCLVDYSGTIALIGYIADEIFVVHAFENADVVNPQIQYRLAEKTDGDAYYIVKVLNAKLMVKLSKNSISLEMVM